MNNIEGEIIKDILLIFDSIDNDKKYTIKIKYTTPNIIYDDGYTITFIDINVFDNINNNITGGISFPDLSQTFYNTNLKKKFKKILIII